MAPFPENRKNLPNFWVCSRRDHPPPFSGLAGGFICLTAGRCTSEGAFFRSRRRVLGCLFLGERCCVAIVGRLDVFHARAYSTVSISFLRRCFVRFSGETRADFASTRKKRSQDVERAYYVEIFVGVGLASAGGAYPMLRVLCCVQRFRRLSIVSSYGRL